ncbi:hypothetical protein THTE_3371 [Thermogutta terrifontis]|uniref:Uncharacterized protein n=1 Tax=Thermogutta terrifontis TaxID=1331910 RepID=A0A286RJ38_9BACT|nr:hypothetical protein THTE_3371 [Thermogutta terrifontis]
MEHRWFERSSTATRLAQSWSRTASPPENVFALGNEAGQ